MAFVRVTGVDDIPVGKGALDGPLRCRMDEALCVAVYPARVAGGGVEVDLP